MFRKLRIKLLIAGGVCSALLLGAAVFIQSTGYDRDTGRITNVLFDELSVQVTAVIDEARITLASYNDPTLGPCNLSSIEAMRRLIYTNIYVKDLAITDDSGDIICNASGFKQTIRVRSKAQMLTDDGVTLVAVQVEAAQFEGLMISRKLGPNRQLSALVLSNALLSARGQRVVLEGGFALLSLTDGTDVGRYPASRLTAPSKSRGDSFRTMETDLNPLPLKLRLYVANATLDKLVRPSHTIPLILGALVLAVLALVATLYFSSKRETPLSDLEHALEKREFIAHYQPIVNIQTGNFIGCEALIRWRKPDGTIVPPGVFIQQAENSGLAVPMTVLLMKQIRADLEALYSMNPSLKVGINLFSDHFNRRETAREVESVFASSDIAFEQLTFEVTERLPITSSTKAKRVIKDLQDLGCKVALDDVGTGHNGLQYLMELGVDIIKIDKLFVDGVSQSGFSETIIEALVKLATDMHMDVVAEGVETNEQMQKLKGLGIDMAQGYLFSKPLPPEQFLELLDRSLSAQSASEDTKNVPVRAKDHLHLVDLNKRVKA